MLTLYQLFTQTLLPLYLKRVLRRRLALGKEMPERVKERQGQPSQGRPPGPLIWIHGASVGESLSILTLIGRLRQSFPKVTLLVTTGTVTSAKLLEHKLPRGVIHQFIPLDVPQWVKSFLNHWRPDLALWVESEFWPNLLSETRARDIPIVLINGRISDRSFRRWHCLKPFIRKILSQFTLCLAQSEQQAERFWTLGAQQIESTGNIKFSAQPLPYEPEELADLTQQIGSRKIWVATSTHPGEEEILAQAHHYLRSVFPDLLTFLIPRHPHRGSDIKKILQPASVGLRSQKDLIRPTTQFYIGDTLGELGLFYRLAPVVFMGKSLQNPGGGQNPIEPAQLHCAILHGPYMGNFREVMALFQRAQASIEVRDGKTLAQALETLFKHPQDLKTLQERAFQVASSQTTVLDLVFSKLEPFLNRLI